MFFDVEVFDDFWLVFVIFKGIFMVFMVSGWFLLRFIDHCMQLFPIVANHRSSVAMFAMDRSSFMLLLYRKCFFFLLFLNAPVVRLW